MPKKSTRCTATSIPIPIAQTLSIHNPYTSQQLTLILSSHHHHKNQLDFLNKHNTYLPIQHPYADDGLPSGKPPQRPGTGSRDHQEASVLGGRNWSLGLRDGDDANQLGRDFGPADATGSLTSTGAFSSGFATPNRLGRGG